MISLLSIPTDRNSSFLKGSSFAPKVILKEFHSEARNKFAENGVELTKGGNWNDIGDLELKNLTHEQEFNCIKDKIQEQLKEKNYCVSLGGDHSITYPIIKGYSKFYPNINILHFDAHPDLYHNFDENYYSHASPFARIMEEDLANSLTQIGIRTLNDHQRLQVNKYGVRVVEMNNFSLENNLELGSPLYISIDIDALDPAFAPGVSHAEPGGLTTRDIIRVISKLDVKIIGADIVEYNPNMDLKNITAITAAKLLKEIMGKMCEE